MPLLFRHSFVREKRLLGATAACCAGCALILTGNPPLQVVGGLLVLLGGAILTQEALRWERHRRRRRQEAFAEAQRTAKRRVRRERETQVRLERQEERERAERIRVRQAESEAQRRAAEVAQQRALEAERRARTTAQEAEANRLLALDDADLRAEVLEIWGRRGYSAQALPDAPDYVLLQSEMERALLHCLPSRQVAVIEDLQRLEAWRREVGASSAYLIALGGFTPQAVRMTRHLPITLVEAHLLAHWTQQPFAEAKRKES